MHDCKQKGCVDGREAWPLAGILAENALYLAIWGLSGALLWPIWTPDGVPALGLGWIALVVVVQVALKKHNCSGCHYHGKACHLGWGKLSAALFPPDSGNPRLALAFSLFYVLTPPLVLLAAILQLVFRAPGWPYAALLGGWVLCNGLTMPLRKRGCAQCCQRMTCPGSACRK